MKRIQPLRSLLKGAILCLFMLTTVLRLSTQSIINYTFSASSGSFTVLSGATNPSPLIGDVDDGYFNGIPIGFDFWYMGTRYTTVSASTNGWLTLGANITDPVFANSLASGGAPRPVIAPLWDDLDIQNATNVSYLTSGSAPNRVFTIQYLNAQWDYQATGNTISFQVKMYEGTGRVEFTYRQETGSLNSASASIGITATATGSGNYLSVRNTGTSVTSTSENNINSKPVTGNRYLFTPPVPAAPASLIFSAIDNTSMTLNWSDLSSNERGFLIYRSTDGTNYSFVTQTAAGVTTSVQSGLSAATLYYWKIYAVSEGGFSTSALSGSQTTACTPPAAPTVTSPVSYCQNATAIQLTATGSSLLWGGLTGSAGGTTALTNAVYVDNASNNKKTKFTTTAASVKITTVDYYIPAYQAVTGLVLSIYNSGGTVIATSSTTTTLTAGSATARVSSVFNYTLTSAGDYSIGVSAGTGNIGYDNPSFPVSESTGTINITGVTPAGSRCFNNIQFLVLSGSTAPTPSTTMTGSFNYTVTQTVSGCVSPAATIVVNVTAPNISQIPGTSAIGNYPFTGNANDISGNNNQGTLQNSPALTTDRFGNSNQAYSFNGSTQYISTSAQYVSPANFTISIWFKTTTTSGGKLIGFSALQTGQSSQYDRHIYMSNSGQIYFGVYPGAIKSINSTLSYNDNNWHLATATLSSVSGMTLYVDNVQVAADATTTTAEGTTGYWRLGYDNLSGWTNLPTSNYFNGVLDEALIYHRALSGAEVTTLYNSPDGAGNNGPVCTGSTLTLSATTLSGATYAWSGPGGFTSSAQNPTFTYASANAGTYTVTVTAAGCTAAAYTNVTSTTNAGQWTGSVSTDWATADNWCSGVVPTSAVNVTIPAAAANMPSITGSAACKNLTINTGATLTTTSSGTLSIAGTLTNSGTMTNSGATVFNGTSGQQTFSGVSSFYNLTLNNSSGMLLPAAIAITNHLTLTAGTLNANNFNMSVGGNWVNNSGTAAFTGGTAAVTFNGTAAQSIGGSFVTTFNNLSISNTGNTVSLGINTSVTGNLLVATGTFDLGSYTANRASSGGTLTVSNGATLKIGGTNAYPSNYTASSLAAASTVEYAGGNQTVTNQVYGNLTLSSSGGATVKTFPGTALSVAGNLTSTLGAGASLTYTAASNITVNGVVSIGASTIFNGGSYAHSVGNNWTNNGTYNGGTGTVTFTGPGSTIGGSGTQNFNNLTVYASLVNIAGVNITVSGNLATTSSGSFTQASGGTFFLTGTGKTISGVGISMQNLDVSGSVSTAASLDIKGNLAVSGSLSASAGSISMSGTSKTISGAGTRSFSVLNISGSITTDADFSIASGLTVEGSFSASAGTGTFTGTSTLSGTADLYNATINGTSLQLSSGAVMGVGNTFTISSGTLNVTSSIPNTVRFNGSGAQTVNAITYDVLQLSNGNTKTAAGGITVNNTITIGAATTFAAGAYTHSIYMDWNNNGTFTAGSGTVQFLGTQNRTLTGVTAFNTVTVNTASGTSSLILNDNISAATVNMTQGMILTGANALTITTTRTGNGIILGNILRTHTFSTGIAYAFEGPDNTITFSSVSSVDSVLVSVAQEPITGFPYDASISREYEITIPNGTYTATLRLHYEDNELNGNAESTLALWTFDGTYWIPVGKTANSTTSNYVEHSGLTDVEGFWTCSYSQDIAQWNGSVSSDWNTAANWTILQGAGSLPPGPTDIAVLGTAAFNHEPTISTAVTVKNTVFGSAQAVTLTMAGGGSLNSGNILGVWNGVAAAHTIYVNNQSIVIDGDLSLSDGTSGHTIDLNIGAGSVTISGTLHQVGGADVVFSSAGALNIADDYHYVSGTFTPGTGTVTYNGVVNQAIAAVDYYNLTIDNAAAAAVISNPFLVGGSLTLDAGELDNQSVTTISGNVNIASGATLHNQGTLYIGGDWNNSGTYNASESVAVFDGAGTQTISPTTFHNLVIDKPVGTTAELTGMVLMNGDLTVTSGTLDIGSFVCDRTVLGGTLTLADSATFIVGGNNPPANFANGTLALSSTVIADGTDPQLIFGVDFGNLIFRNAGAKTLVSPITVHGNLVIESGASFDAGANTLTLGGNWVNDGTFTPSTSTIVCTGTSKNISGNSTFNRFSVYGSYTILDDVTFDQLLVINSGGSISGGSTIHTTMNGDLINHGILYTLGTTTFTGNVLQTLSLINAVQTVAITVNFNGTVPPVLNSTSAPQYGYLNINNTGGITPSTGWSILYGLNVGTGASFNGGIYTHNLLGSLDNNGTITGSGTFNFIPSSAATIDFGADFSSSGTVVLGSTGAITVAGTPVSFNNVLISNTHASGITPASDWEILNDFTVNGSSTFHAGAHTYSVGNNIQVDGTLDAGTSTFILNGTDHQDIFNTSGFYNLTLDKAADVATLFANTSVNGTLHFISGNLNTDEYALVQSATAAVTGAAQNTGWVNGLLQKGVATGATSKTFEVGDATTYAPVNLAFSNVTTTGSLTVSTTAGDHPEIANATINASKSVNRYWKLLNSGTLYNNYSATFHFATGDLDSGVDTLLLGADLYDGSSWRLPVTVLKRSTFVQASNITETGDFAIGEICNAGTAISYTASPYCSDAGTGTATLTGKTGGVFSSITGLSLDDATGAVDLSASTPGAYNVVYTLAAAGGCPQYITSAEIVVTAAPSATITYENSPYCSSFKTAPITRIGTSGGTFSSTDGLVIDTLSGNVDLITSTAGAYTVTYDVAAAGGCSTFSTTADITITTQPFASGTYEGNPYCTDGGIAFPTGYAEGVAGSLSSTAGLSIDPPTGVIDLDLSTPGVYTVTYTVPDTLGCPEYINTATVAISEAPSDSISYTGSPYCRNEGGVSVTHSGGSDGSYSTTSGLSLNTVSGEINTAASTPGTYTVTYTVAAINGCGEYTATASVTIRGEGIWTGAVSDDWDTAGNWICNTIPDGSIDVLVPDSLPHYPVIDAGTAAAHNLAIEPGASLTVTGASLQIGGSISNSGTFTASNAVIECNGSAAQTIPAGTFAGNTIKSLTIDNTSGVTLGGALTLTEVLTVAGGSLHTGGYLTLKSTDTSTAWVAEITSAATTPIDGKVTVERYVQGRRKYRLITSSTTTSTDSTLDSGEEEFSIWGNWQNQGNNSTANTGTLITGGSSTDGFDTQTGNPSLFTYDDINRVYMPYSTGNGYNTKYTPLKAGIAYYMFVYGDRLNSVYATSPHPTVLKSYGTLLTGDQTYNTSSDIPLSGVTGRYTLLGNPFAAPIDWTSLPKTNISSACWGWDPNLGALGGYVTVSSIGDVTIISPFSGSTGLDQYIQPGQGFFVQTTASSPSLSIREQDKVAENNNGAFFTGPATPRNTLSLLAINLLYDNGGTAVLADGVVTAFDDDFSNAPGQEDAAKMASTAECLAIRNGTDSLSIDARQQPQENDTIHLRLARLTKPAYKFQIFGHDMDPAGAQPYLLDRYLDTRQALSLTDTSIIAFSVNPAVPASRAADRFSIVFGSAIALPVKFMSASATLTDRGIEVTWKVSTETGVEKYEVERSGEALHFSRMDEVEATGHSAAAATYTWLDEQPQQGENYYRIYSIGTDGAITYSPIVQAGTAPDKQVMEVYPNPVEARRFHLRINDLPQGDYTIVLLDAGGAQRMEATMTHPGGLFIHAFALDKNIASGVYYLQLQTETGSSERIIYID